MVNRDDTINNWTLIYLFIDDNYLWSFSFNNSINLDVKLSGNFYFARILDTNSGGDVSTLRGVFYIAFEQAFYIH